MRRFLPLLLLAATAAPAWAAEPEEAPAPAREARGEPERPARAERPQRSERLFGRIISQERRERNEAVSSGSEPRVQRERGSDRRERWSSPAPTAEDRPIRNVVRERILRERGERYGRTTGDTSSLPPTSGGSITAGTAQPPLSANRSSRNDRRMGAVLRNRIATEGWRREWREDRRFDWRRHRDRDRSRFRAGFYVDPFGWNYRRWNVGWNMYPGFYSDRYWIDDPWYYSLPPAYGPYRWVRYWNDALLVDLRSGRVVDVLHNFFW